MRLAAGQCIGLRRIGTAAFSRPAARCGVMKFLIDTMVLSEPARPRPEAAAITWLRDQTPLDLAVSVLTFGEIARGVERMKEGRRKQDLKEWLGTQLPAHFGDRVLPVDEQVALTWG